MSLEQPAPDTKIDAALGAHSARTTAIWLALLTVLSILAVVPAAAWSTLSLMALQTSPSALLRIYAGCVITLPLALAIAPILAWIAYGLRWRRLAVVVSLSPALWLAVLMVFMMIHSGR